MTMPPPEDAVHRIDDAFPTPARSRVELAREVVMVLPAILDLLRRLLTDPAVPRSRKILVGVALAYLVSPIDLIPDFIPVLGRFDDVVLAAFAVDRLFKSVPPEVRERYWIGSADTLELITGIAAWGAEMVPPLVRRLFGP